MRQGQIGFMQGRMSPIVDGKIQSFPWSNWRSEFVSAQSTGFSVMEWTIDEDRYSENPIMTSEGRQEISNLSKRHTLQINSVTADCFMQAPFFKAVSSERERRLKAIRTLIEVSSLQGLKHIVFPLVDGGKIESVDQERDVLEVFLSIEELLTETKIKIIFESDYEPQQLKAFIGRLPVDQFGINLDIGNSAALGFPSNEEIDAYGERIYGVHVKDRLYQGSTVPLGEGSADIPATLRQLVKIGYNGNYILQTARAVDGNHLSVLVSYKKLISDILNEK
jgi:L-ribulose-5-phosphate 3-epimerase